MALKVHTLGSKFYRRGVSHMPYLVTSLALAIA
jgi:hypothetical protein